MARKEKDKEIIIRKIVVGPFATNCYLVADGVLKETMIIDPGDNPQAIFDAIKEYSLLPKFILLTHKHPDHIGALEQVKEKLSIEYLESKDGDELTIGNLKIKVLATPGHSAESICFVIGTNVFSGDTLFYHSIGRTDVAGGDFEQIQKSLKRLMEFPDDFKVFPGHGPETTIREERKNNPFLKL